MTYRANLPGYGLTEFTDEAEYQEALRTVSQSPAAQAPSAQNDSEPMRAITDIVEQMRAYARGLPLGSKPQKAVYDVIGKEMDIVKYQGRPLTEVEQRERTKKAIAKDVANIFKILPEIETYRGIKSGPAWLTQLGGSYAGLNPEYAQYRQKIRNLRIPVVKRLQGEGGNTAKEEQVSAEEFFPTGGSLLFEERGRPRALVNLLEGIHSQSGINLLDIVDRQTVERAARSDPEGKLKAFLDASAGTPPTMSAGGRPPWMRPRSPQDLSDEELLRSLGK